MAGRSSALRGNEIVLTAIFLDAGGDYTDPNPLATLKLSIYPPGHDPRLGAGDDVAWVIDATLDSGGSGPYADPLSIHSRSLSMQTLDLLLITGAGMLIVKI
jgi:hypothetical protein